MECGRIHNGTNVENIISVIVPVYNTDKYLDDCLKSLIEQSFRQLDIILINDGSIDKSDQKCREWVALDSRIRYFNRNNVGLGATRNFGVNVSMGKYIMFIDSDDWVDAKFVEKMYKAIESQSADMVFCDYYKFDEVNKKQTAFLTKTYTDVVISGEEKIKLIFGSDVAMWTKIYKKSLFCENKIIIPDGPYEDTATHAIFVACSDKIVHLKEKLLYYRINREGSILATKYNRTYATNALVNLCEEMKKRNFFDIYIYELERFCVRFVSMSLREMQGVEFEVHRQELVSTLYKYFPGVYNPYGRKFLVIGSNNLYCIVNQIPLDFKYTINTNHLNLDKQIGEQDIDYIVIDFQEDSLKQSELDISKIEKLCDFVKSKSPEQIYVLRNLLAYRYGEYTGEQFFEDKDQIDIANQMILKKENVFLKNMEEKFNVIAMLREELIFSDINSRHGCKSFHLNDNYFLEMSDQLIKKIRGAK